MSSARSRDDARALQSNPLLPNRVEIRKADLEDVFLALTYGDASQVSPTKD